MKSPCGSFAAGIAGAAGGCQAEIGTASAMGAAALCYLAGGSADAVCHAAAIAIKSLLEKTQLDPKELAMDGVAQFMLDYEQAV